MKPRKIILLSVFLLSTLILCGAQQDKTQNAFLGQWDTENKALEITIIKEGDLYYVIEFVRIKHELFFSGDGRRALFQEWGKGPGGNNCGLIVSDDGESIGYYGVSDNGEWFFSKTFYKRKQ